MSLIRYNLSVEPRLALPFSKSNEPKVARADAIVTYQAFDSIQLFRLKSLEARSLSWCSDQGSNSNEALQPILKVVEMKPQDGVHAGRRQLAMNMSTGLYHRLSLGLSGDDNVVYGLLQVGTELKLYLATFDKEVKPGENVIVSCTLIS